uniref:Uncharacterized protein n=1 Tax=Ixodes ricinus TaxID=34613 RepID=A0A0K8R583_IXORI
MWMRPPTPCVTFGHPHRRDALLCPPPPASGPRETGRGYSHGPLRESFVGRVRAPVSLFTKNCFQSPCLCSIVFGRNERLLLGGTPADGVDLGTTTRRLQPKKVL